MRTLAVVAYPILSADDREWIEGIRIRYDPLASRIAAHFTLVFATDVAEAPLVAQARSALQSTSPIQAVLRRAVAYPDAIAGGCHVFLLADEGNRELVTAHDALYEGILAPHRRADIPFVPHLTVGAHPQVGECDRIAERLNQSSRIVQARINCVDVVEIDESMIRTIAEIPLRSRGAEPRNATLHRTGGRVVRPPGADRDRHAY